MHDDPEEIEELEGYQEEPQPYLLEYPRFRMTLTTLIERIPGGDAGPIALLVLFGSVARLEPTRWSDADLLVVLDEAPGTLSRVDWRERTLRFLRLARGIETTTGDGISNWPLIPFFCDQKCSGVDLDFLAAVGEHGVRLYQASGYIPPLALAALQPLETWLTHVERALATARP
ncbi:MAG TPA: nucleotidyltransferase domain-containing protein [Ktedonobacterales bacterium]